MAVVFLSVASALLGAWTVMLWFLGRDAVASLNRTGDELRRLWTQVHELKDSTEREASCIGERLDCIDDACELIKERLGDIEESRK